MFDPTAASGQAGVAVHPAELYHRWYYDSNVWRGVGFLGVYAAKSVTDLWNYQEILSAQLPSLVVEFGTYAGGSALYFATILQALHSRQPWRVFSVDVDLTHVSPRVSAHPGIELLESSTTHARVAYRISQLRDVFPGPLFAILDSDHHAPHVLDELLLLRDVTREGDYVVVEDSNLNGHPVLPDWGPGPWEAIRDYEQRFPEDYTHDTERERKFGFTFAPSGFLRRNRR